MDSNGDVDPFNIFNICGENTLLSEALSSYYSSHYKNRYNTFITKQGGLDNLEKRAKDYTYGEELVKHKILNEFATTAYNSNPKSIKKKVTKNESEALTYAFITWLKELR
jgi:hypothetical protein